MQRRTLYRWEASELIRDPYVLGWFSLLTFLAYAATYVYGMTRTDYFLRFVFFIVPLGFVFIASQRRDDQTEADFQKVLLCYAISRRDLFVARYAGFLTIAGVYLAFIAPAAVWYAFHLPQARMDIAAGGAVAVLVFVALGAGGAILSRLSRKRFLVTQISAFLLLFSTLVFTALLDGAAPLLQAFLSLNPAVAGTYAANAFITATGNRIYAFATALVVSSLMVILAVRYTVDDRRQLTWAAVGAAVLAIVAAAVFAGTVDTVPDELQKTAGGAFAIHLHNGDGTLRLPTESFTVGQSHPLILSLKVIGPDAGPRDVKVRISGSDVAAEPAVVHAPLAGDTVTIPISLTLAPQRNAASQPYILVVELTDGERISTSSKILFGHIAGFEWGIRIAPALLLLLLTARWVRVKSTSRNNMEADALSALGETP